MLKVAHPRDVSEVRAQFLGEGQWRLVNSTVDRADAAGVLGFVQRVGAGYEVLDLEHPESPRRVSSLREARALFVDPGTVLVAPEPSRAPTDTPVLLQAPAA